MEDSRAFYVLYLLVLFCNAEGLEWAWDSAYSMDVIIDGAWMNVLIAHLADWLVPSIVRMV